jgi:hypothetical protein
MDTAIEQSNLARGSAVMPKAIITPDVAHSHCRVNLVPPLLWQIVNLIHNDLCGQKLRKRPPTNSRVRKKAMKIFLVLACPDPLAQTGNP